MEMNMITISMISLPVKGLSTMIAQITMYQVL